MSLRGRLIRLAHEEPELRGPLLTILKQARARFMPRGPLSSRKKIPAEWMWHIVKEQHHGRRADPTWMLTLGHPMSGGSKVKLRMTGTQREFESELTDWIGRKVSPDHVYDHTGSGIVPDTYSEFFMETAPENLRRGPR